MKILAIVGLGGFLGAVCRHMMSEFVARNYNGVFPFATLIVNVFGCFLLGLCIFFLEKNTHLSPAIKLGLGTGFLGAFTTFSTFGVETHNLLTQGEQMKAFLNVGGNLFLGLIAVFVAFHFVETICQS